MKRISIFLILICIDYLVFSQEISRQPDGNCQKAEVSQWIGLVKITITYHSPSVRSPSGVDRKGHIWGELVRYGFFDDGHGPSKSTPWRAGANESTAISFSHDLKIEGKDIKAGTYALFLDVEKEGSWNWIFSSQLGWGSYQYDPRNDVLRVPVNPEDGPYTECLTYGFDDRKTNSAIAFLRWENKQISFKIDVPNINQLYIDQIRKELLAWAGFGYENWRTAALICVRYKINLDEALTWADKAIYGGFRGVARSGKMEFSTLQAKALVLLALGRNAEADTVLDAAIHQPGTTSREISFYVNNLIERGIKTKAIEVAKYDQKIHADEKFWPYLNLAKAYSSLSDKKNAIKNWELAIQNIPEDQKESLPDFENELKRLKEIN